MTGIRFAVRALRLPFQSTALAVALALPLGAAAKLPPLTPEAAAKADEAKAKAAWTTQVELFKLCRAMDRVAVVYRSEAPKAGKTSGPPTETPPCSEPPAFVYSPAAAPTTKPPIEAAGAHSPAATAVAPPNSLAPQSVQQPTTTAKPPIEAAGAHSPSATAVAPPSTQTPQAAQPSPKK